MSEMQTIDETRRMGGEQPDNKPAMRDERPAELPVWALQMRQEYEHQLKIIQDERDEWRKQAELITASPVNAPLPLITIDEVQKQVKFIEQLVKECMTLGRHYGESFPNGPRTLLKAGADLLTSVFGVRPRFNPLTVVQEWKEQIFVYRYECELILIGTGQIVGTGIGLCSSMEEKYAYRQANRVCPTCRQETIIKGKAEWGGGWVCLKKKGGCGAKYGPNDLEITNQQVGRVPNAERASIANTLDKMAQKRAMMAAVLTMTGVTGFFADYDADEDHDQPDDQPATSGAVINGSSKPAQWPPLNPREVEMVINEASKLLKEKTGKIPQRDAVSKSCMNTLGLTSWQQSYNGTLQDALEAIRLQIETRASSEAASLTKQERIEHDDLTERDPVYEAPVLAGEPTDEEKKDKYDPWSIWEPLTPETWKPLSSWLMQQFEIKRAADVTPVLWAALDAGGIYPLYTGKSGDFKALYAMNYSVSAVTSCVVEYLTAQQKKTA